MARLLQCMNLERVKAQVSTRDSWEIKSYQVQVLNSLGVKTFCSISIMSCPFFLVKVQSSYVRHLAAITLQHIYKILITVAKGYNSSINHLPIIKSSISYTQVQNYAETLGLYFVAALSNRALFSSKSAKYWWSGLALWSFLHV